MFFALKKDGYIIRSKRPDATIGRRNALAGLGFVLCTIGFLLLSGCNICNTGGGPDTGTDKDIYFTALPLNSDIPGIFAISPNEGSLREIVRNGIMYSQPSRDGKIAYLRNNPDGNDEIRIVNTNGSNDVQIVDKRRAGTSITFPVLSPNGEYVAYIGADGLYIVSKNGTLGVRISSSMTSGTLPVFSPDGRWIAFYEGDRNTGPMKLKVVNSSDLLDIRMNKILDGDPKAWIGDLTIDWLNDGSTLIFSLNTDSTSKVYRLRVDEPGNPEIVDLDVVGAFQPVISPADNSLVAFSSRSRDIYMSRLDDSNHQFTRLTEIDTTADNKYAQWSADGKFILFSRFYLDETNYATLILVDINKGTQNGVLLSNNVVGKGFWKR